MTIDLPVLVAELKYLSLPRQKMIVGIPLDVIRNMTKKEAADFIQTNRDPEYDILASTYDAMKMERLRLIEEFDSFYYSKSSDFQRGRAFVNEILLVIQKMAIRIARLILVFEPKYYHNTIKNSQGYKYDIVKSQWIDDKGNLYINKARTYGKTGQDGLEKALPKLIENHIEGLRDYFFPSGPIEGFRFDWLVNIHGKLWGFEFKMTDKSNFLKTAVRLELWNLYKKVYSS